MSGAATFPPAAPIRSARLVLDPLRVEHAAEMAPVLDDPSLHAFIGGRPLSAAQLAARYRRLVDGPPSTSGERWLNWIVRLADGTPVGTVEATVNDRDGRTVAAVAWVIAAADQRRGLGSEAAATMAGWLRERGVERVVAHIHPAHAASERVAAAAGLHPMDVVHDGERRWEG